MSKTKKIKIQLSDRSILEAISQINKYKFELSTKTKLLVDRLAEIGINTINVTMMGVAPMERGEYTVTPTPIEGGANSAVQRMSIQLTGDQILFIEFSSGKTFGTSSFPALPNNPSYGSGYGMGTYPNGKGHWDDPEGWWYKDKYGESQHTYGIRARAPMYHADEDMRKAIESIAREVFGG